MNGASKMATVWFADNERAMATAVGSLATPLGAIIGSIMAPFFIFDTDKYHIDDGKTHVEDYMLIAAVLVTVMNIPILFFFKEAPVHYPSKAAQSAKKEEFSMKNDLKLMAKNKNFILLLIIFSSLYGCYTCLGAVINDICEPYGFGSADAGMFVGIFIVSGLTGSFILSGYLDKYNAYLKILRLVCCMSLIFSTGMVFSLDSGILWLVCINISFLGFFLLPIIPVSYSFAVELTYPVSEAMSNGLLMLFS